MSIPPQIERGVPLPPKRTTCEPRTMLTRVLHLMDAGESILVPEGQPVNSAIISTRNYFQRRGESRTYTYRTEASGRVRIWRTK